MPVASIAMVSITVVSVVTISGLRKIADFSQAGIRAVASVNIF
ncbi:hypothetical protein [Trichormus variabilis]|nr:hypothetical protein [Trichormus variabilis]